MHGRYVTDILKMCMKKRNAEQIFLTNLQGFDLHIAGGYTVHLACSQFRVFYYISFILAGNKDNYKVSDLIKFRPDPAMDCGVKCP